ncbi:benzoate 4-monooxygenase cytochrome P450 [Penicillium longicatenatum]|uniref:benzoate 4-monooxygenase cytochrome P450 n=1 Tax=Penicillium longicatenatum TaxID=1561947 RepID=UPI00254980B7|nr:benzoate 4-monooxygenase cytochrome P450 [Penicillium longicatenatum]KAJ5650428.1 benzoate 4-monooxygenase cytochrome P450 [Penicillium longicatenatum]
MTSLVGVLVLVTIACQVIYKLYGTPLRKVPGPMSFAITKWRLAYEDYKGVRTRFIHALHQNYGTAVRVGPNEVSFSSLSALRTIYGAGSGFERTDFYRMFDVYGRQNLFSFAEAKKHTERKKLLAHAYSKSTILSPHEMAKPLIEKNVKSYLDLLDREKGVAEEVYQSLHWFSLDSITGFLYGEKLQYSGTDAIGGNKAHRSLVGDIINPGRRKLSWFMVHLRVYTKWLYRRTGITKKVVESLRLLPMQNPTTYSGIQTHALLSTNKFDISVFCALLGKPHIQEPSVMEKLWNQTDASEETRLGSLDRASEMADHCLAGIDTTSDTLMFAIWALSRHQNKAYQQKLIEEVTSISEKECNEDGIPTVEAADKLPYLGAIIKETLRLYAPLPASEPRSLPVDTMIDGYAIPARTVVSMSPYTLHRNAEVFPDPLVFKPERWLGECGDLAEMKKWFWAFSSGGRMCIGLHLAMAEMTTLLAAIYREYTTSEYEKQRGVSPGITSRFEVFYDETLPRMEVSQ